MLWFSLSFFSCKCLCIFTVIVIGVGIVVVSCHFFCSLFVSLFSFVFFSSVVPTWTGAYKSIVYTNYIKHQLNWIINLVKFIWIFYVYDLLHILLLPLHFHSLWFCKPFNALLLFWMYVCHFVHKRRWKIYYIREYSWIEWGSCPQFVKTTPLQNYAWEAWTYY